jgi:hypothetical protein
MDRHRCAAGVVAQFQALVINAIETGSIPQNTSA